MTMGRMGDSGKPYLVTISATAAGWWVALNHALLSSCATTAKERTRPVQSIQRGVETERADASDMYYLEVFWVASTRRGVGRPVGCFDAKLLCVFAVQSLPAVELHCVGSD